MIAVQPVFDAVTGNLHVHVRIARVVGRAVRLPAFGDLKSVRPGNAEGRQAGGDQRNRHCIEVDQAGMILYVQRDRQPTRHT